MTDSTGSTGSTGNGPQQPQQPAEIDPEQLRQFQEFQRFQDYQRFQQAREGHAPLALPPGHVGPASQPPAVPPPPVQTVYVKPAPKPLWQIILGSWPVRWLVTLLVLALLANYGYNRWFGGGGDDPGDVANDSGGTKGNIIAPLKAYGTQGTVGIFYKHVSQGSDVQACNLFAEDGRAKQKFTTAFSAPDCGAAIRSLKAKVLDVSAYEQPVFPETMYKEPLTTTAEVSSCKDLVVTGGPRLGAFVLTQQVNKTWIISDYTAEPVDCLTG